MYAYGILVLHPKMLNIQGSIEYNSSFHCMKLHVNIKNQSRGTKVEYIRHLNLISSKNVSISKIYRHNLT